MVCSMWRATCGIRSRSTPFLKLNVCQLNQQFYWKWKCTETIKLKNELVCHLITIFIKLASSRPSTFRIFTTLTLQLLTEKPGPFSSYLNFIRNNPNSSIKLNFKQTQIWRKYFEDWIIDLWLSNTSLEAISYY